MTFVADENFPRPALGALRKAGWEVFSVAEECPGISDEEVAALCSESHQVLLTFDKDFGELVSIGGFQREAESSCSGSFPNLPKKWRTPPWHCFSLSPIYAGSFALSHVSEFESGPCARPRSADRWRHDATKISYMYRARRFFVLRRIGKRPATACAKARGIPLQTEPLITLDSTWTPLQTEPVITLDSTWTPLQIPRQERSPGGVRAESNSHGRSSGVQMESKNSTRKPFVCVGMRCK